jgi:hypothetical protein
MKWEDETTQPTWTIQDQDWEGEALGPSRALGEGEEVLCDVEDCPVRTRTGYYVNDPNGERFLLPLCEAHAIGDNLEWRWDAEGLEYIIRDAT